MSRYEDTLRLTRDTGWLLGFGSAGRQSVAGAFATSWLLADVDFSMAFCIRKICPNWSQSAETLGLLTPFLAPLAGLLGLMSTFRSLTEDVLGSVMFSGTAGVTWFFLFVTPLSGEPESSIMRHSSSESMFPEECLIRLAGVHSAVSSTVELESSSSDTEFKVVSALLSTELSSTLALVAASSFAGVGSADIMSFIGEASSVNMCDVLSLSKSTLGLDNPCVSLLEGA